MALQNVSNYQRATLAAPLAEVGSGDDTWVLVYNNTGSAISNGAIKEISFLVDTGTINTEASTSAPMIVGVPKAPATSAGEITLIGVVDNFISSAGTIANASWGYVKTAGVVRALCNGSTDIAIGDQLEILNAGTAFTQASSATSGASGLIVPECVAIALEAYTASTDALKYVYLLGRQCLVKAT